MDGFFHFTVKVTLIFPLLLSGRDFIGINLPLTLIVAACRSAEVIFSNAGWSPVTASALNLAVVPAVLRNPSYSTHSWRSPHMTCRYWEP